MPRHQGTCPVISQRLHLCSWQPATHDGCSGDVAEGRVHACRTLAVQHLEAEWVQYTFMLTFSHPIFLLLPWVCVPVPDHSSCMRALLGNNQQRPAVSKARQGN